MTALITIFVLVMFGLIFLFTKEKKDKVIIGQDNSNGNNRQLQSNTVNFIFPERTDAIEWHIQSIKKGLQSGNLELTNLSYAKLIESVRQQNVNSNGEYENVLEQVREEYQSFRQKFNLDYPAQFLPSSQKKKTRSNEQGNDLVNTSNHTKENTISIDLNDEIDFSEDEDIEDIVGFYGTEKFSPNKKYCVVYSDGHYENDKWENGKIAILKGKELLFKKRLERPNSCFVSNNGITICCDWLNSDDLVGRFRILDQTGKQIFSKKTSANLGMCGISDDGKIAIFESYDSTTEDANKIFVIDIEKRKIISKFNRPSSFNKVQISTKKSLIRLIDSRNFTYEVDFLGNQTNKKELDAQILKEGSIYDKVLFYSAKSDEEKFRTEEYLDVLHKAAKDEDTRSSFGLDRIYRMIGEFHEANNDINKTIKYWEKAIEINPKIGVKRKLNKLKKN